MNSRHPETPDERISLPPNESAGLAQLRRLEEPQPQSPGLCRRGRWHPDRREFLRLSATPNDSDTITPTQR